MAKVLEAELKVAASKTTVSSVPAFLATHLKRKLAQKAKTEGRGRDNGGESSAASQVITVVPDRRLNPDEMSEQARMISELIESGYSMEQAETQFAASFHAEDWSVIREAIKGSKTKSDE